MIARTRALADKRPELVVLLAFALVAAALPMTGQDIVTGV